MANFPFCLAISVSMASDSKATQYQVKNEYRRVSWKLCEDHVWHPTEGTYLEDLFSHSPAAIKNEMQTHLTGSRLWHRYPGSHAIRIGQKDWAPPNSRLGGSSHRSSGHFDGRWWLTSARIVVTCGHLWPANVRCGPVLPQVSWCRLLLAPVVH